MSLVLPRPYPTGMTTRVRRLWFFTSFVIGCASMNAATGYAGPLRVPQVVQLVLGLLMVFVVPGLSAVCAALPQWQSWVERLLASLGISIAVATCLVVLLAATPIGFSRAPFGELLGGVTVALSVGGLYRLKSGAAAWELRVWIKEKLSRVKERVIVDNRGPQRSNNPAKTTRPRPSTEDDVRRSVVTLKFTFEGNPPDPQG
jgi:hypothetical protein